MPFSKAIFKQNTISLSLVSWDNRCYITESNHTKLGPLSYVPDTPGTLYNTLVCLNCCRQTCQNLVASVRLLDISFHLIQMRCLGHPSNYSWLILDATFQKQNTGGLKSHLSVDAEWTSNYHITQLHSNSVGILMMHNFLQHIVIVIQSKTSLCYSVFQVQLKFSQIPLSKTKSHIE